MSLTTIQIILLIGVVSGFNIAPTNPHSPSTNPEKSSNENLELRCLELSATFSPEEPHLSSFKAGGTLQCWLHCKYTFKCFIFLYDTISGNCFLYGATQEFAQRNTKKFNYLARKECLEKKTVEMVLAAKVLNPQPGQEFLIRQTEPLISCLTKVKSDKPDADLVKIGGYSLRWNTCAESNSWGLRRVEHETDKLKTQDFFQIFMIEEPDMCLDVKPPESKFHGRRQVILTKCQEITQTNEENSQIMFLLKEKLSLQGNNISSFGIHSITEAQSEARAWSLYPGVGNDQNSGALLGITFTTSSTLRGQAGCHLSQFTTTHGEVDNWNKVPFFLPGEEVTVLCEPGYGVSALNYSSLQSLVCGEGKKTLPCSLIKSEEDQDEENSEGDEEEKEWENEQEDKKFEKETEGSEVRDLRFYLLLTFAIVGSAVALIELVLIFVIRRKTYNKEEELPIHVTTTKQMVSGTMDTQNTVLVITTLMYDKNGVSFSYIEYNINYGPTSDDSEETNVTIFILYALMVFTPVTLIVTSTLLTFLYLVRSRMVTQRTGGDKRWQGMVVVVTTATIYCVSVIPGSVTIFVDIPEITSNRVLESKLLLLEFPLHARRWTVTKAHITCACIWILALSIPAVRLSLDGEGLVFDFIEYNINYDYISKYSKAVKIAIHTISVLVIDIPVAIVIITTCLTLVHLIRSRKAARRSGGDQRWQGIVTVVAAGTVYCVANLPDRTTFLIFDVISSTEIPHHIYLSRFCECFSTFNIMCNFFIYSLTVPSFKAFLKSKITDVISGKVREYCRRGRKEGKRDQDRENSGNEFDLMECESRI
ncbi:hypothetical protein ACHWQZ_G019485 [Mnemiopsis leidyi]